ncbi:acyloxyacyl hydrolase [Geobacter sp. DSM 9736]|uniref:acyloxyacyl hydrolase n=1 Tax=Geobacter sp. DSM 9736 TaxID=1277350 RepID=UPI000B4FF8A0|nr:acyloxyacyl hydrolase [Geobacter sp. DSM 9736]SNB47653.1 Lipid A 3-O-deacylase (PagL) [Geobacter sp. DSM 9736]
MVAFIVAIVFVLFYGATPPACAGENVTLAAATGELALLGGYGITHRGFGATRSQVQTVDAILRYGHFLSEEVGNGWYRGRHEIIVELPVHLTLDPRVRTMVGGYLLGSWKFSPGGNLSPYLLWGGGILINDLGLQTQGTRLNFSYQGGTGINWFFSKSTALTAEYRYHHISNAGTAEPNEPLNSSKFLFGLTRLH